MSMMDDDTLQMYIEESKEHLESIESDLLEIEKGGAEIDEGLVNKVFRAAHSIKGGGGFLGLDNIKELAHKIENILDLIRTYQMVPTPDILNIILLAFDRLGELMDNAEGSNEMEIAQHVDALKELVTSTVDEVEPHSMEATTKVGLEDGPSFIMSQYDLQQARRGGKNLYLVEFDLIEDVHRQNKKPIDLIKLLEDAGDVIDVQMSIASAGDLDSDDISPKLPMFVLFSTIIEIDLISTFLSLPNERIKEVPKELDKPIEGLTVADQQPPPPAASDKEKSTPEVAAAPSTPKTASKNPPARQKNGGKDGGGSKGPPQTTSSPKSETLRVSVAVLDQLMNRAGELVLARNELLQAIAGADQKVMSAAGQKMDLVTSELQEAIMLTRMQPVANIFNKFPRVVRDLSRSLAKEMELVLEGQEVELDKTIIEGLADPLTHLVRNSCDHGIEIPAVRQEEGKQAQGKIVLRAFHESGQVIIEIEDDGKGLDPEKLVEKALSKGLISEEQASTMTDKEKTGLIMLPGFSTAEQVTEVSGRGVGMDVVKTNLDKLGGQVELLSELNKGTIVRIKLPLTLAIIPSLLISSGKERFALPQVNVGELLRIPVKEIREKIEKIGGADVLILRGELIPLLQLSNVLKLNRTYYNYKKGEFKRDRRAELADQRLQDEVGREAEAPESAKNATDIAPERRSRRDSDVSIVILQTGSIKFGLVVDAVHDTIEIVVKPLGRHLKGSEVYAGATVMGDGRVALILDVAGLAKEAELRAITDTDRAKKRMEKEAKAGATRQTLLLFQNGIDEYCAIPLHLVLRVDQIEAEEIEIKGGKKVIQYRGGNLPVFALEEVINVQMLEERKSLIVIIFVVAGREVGLLAIPPLDVIEEDLILDEATLVQQGVSGSAIIRGKTTLLIDIFGFIEALNPDWFEKRVQPEIGGEQSPSGQKPILLAEDSQFFRAQVQQFLLSEGYEVVEAEDGLQAWNYLKDHPEDIGLVVTDIEMPNMDGFELCKHIKSDKRFSHLKVLALTSLAGEGDRDKGLEAGIDDYQIKLDKEQLLQGIYKHLKNQ